MNAPLLDAEARRIAASELDSNLVVTAGAGTGKTSLLVERVLHLVLSGTCSLPGIRALTFTEKAAAEMKRRVADALEDAVACLSTPATGNSPDQAEAGRVLGRLTHADRGDLLRTALAALDDFDRAAIGTIHALCADMLRRHPREAGLPPEFVIDDSVTAGPRFDEIWAAFLEEECGPRGSRGELWSRVLGEFRLENVEAVARRLYGSPAVRELLAEESHAPRDARDLFGDEAGILSGNLRDLVDEVTAKRGKLQPLMRTAADLLDRFRSKGLEAMRRTEVSTLAFPAIWTHAGTLSPGKDNPRGEEITRIATAARSLLQDLYRIREREITDLLETLRPFCREVRSRVLREGRVSFDDLLILTRDLLRDVPAVRRDEAGRFQVLLVDEFQDTDPLQYEIVFFLAAVPDSPERDAYSLPLVPGRLFIVGDPKQSIYRFRGADMTAYRRAVDHVLSGGRGATLSVSFRSVPEILTPVNRLFDGWIGEVPDRSVDPAYDRIEPRRPAGPAGTGVEIWSVPSPSDAPARERRVAEAAVIATQLRAWIHTEGIPAREIAILFRSLTDIPLTTRALRQAGIDFVVEGGRAFAERPEVVDSFALLRALANPGDAVPVLGVLRSALGAMTDAELASYAKAGGTFLWDGESRDVPPRIDAVFRQLRALEAGRREAPLDRWIQMVLTESEFLLVQSAFRDGVQRVANVRKLADRVATLVREGDLTLEEAVDELEEVLDGDRAEGESPLADEAVNAVRILSIHKAKGLEFRAVLVPDLGRNPGGRCSEIEVEIHRVPQGPLIGVSLPGRTAARNAAGLAARRDRERHEEAEAKRLLYVAATRARDRLVLVNSSTTRLSAWIRGLTRLGYTIDPRSKSFPVEGMLSAGVRHRILSGSLPAAARESASSAQVLAAHLRFVDARDRANQPRPPRFRNPSRDPRAGVADRDGGDLIGPGVDGGLVPGAGSLDRDLARGVGIAVHAALERWDFGDPEGLRTALTAATRRAAGDLGLDPVSMEADGSRVIEGLLASGLPAELASANILGREVPILTRDDGGRVVLGYVDLVYRRHGRVHVADYKTDADTGSVHAADYRDQLLEYAGAVADAMGLETPPIMEVLFIRTGRRVVLDAEGSR